MVGEKIAQSSPQSISAILSHFSKVDPGAPAILANGAKPLSYGELFNLAASSTQFLRSRGIGKGDHVAIIAPNGPGLATIFLSVVSGSACTPLNPELSSQEFEYFLKQLQSKALVLPVGYSSQARTAAQRLGVAIYEFNFANPRAGSVAAPDFTGANDVALVAFTSGTTSTPKPVALSQNTLCTSAAIFAKILGLKSQAVCLNVMPLFHTHGLTGGLLSSLSVGSAVHCSAGYDADTFFDELISSRATWYTAVPSIHSSILEYAEGHLKPEKIPRLSVVRSSSSPLGKDLTLKLEKLFNAPVIDSYGMTEVTPIATTELPPAIRKFGSVGRPAMEFVAIFDANDRELSQGEVGEVRVKGANVFSGYGGDPAANQNSFKSGWFCTGDLGYLDSDGYLYLTGRAKDEINRAGEKISPLEVDEALTRHPAVREAATFALPHPSLGEEVAAAIVLNQAGVQEAELREFLAEKLAPFKIPKIMIFVPSLPRSSTGKLLRRKVYETFKDLLEANEAPTTESERALAELFSRELKVDVSKIGINKSFFALGGDSLRALTVVRRVNGILNTAYTVPDFAKFSSISDLTKNASQHPASGQQVAQKTMSYPISVPITAQTQLYLMISPYVPGQRTLILRVLESEREVDRAAVAETVDILLQRYPYLKSVFAKSADGQWAQSIVEKPSENYVSFLDGSSVPADKIQSFIAEEVDKIESEVAKKFGSGKTPFHFAAYDLGKDRPKGVLISIHHVLTDAYASIVLCEAFSEIYSSLVHKKTVNRSVKDFNIQGLVEAQRSSLARMQKDPGWIRYWEQTFKPSPPPFPVDFPDKLTDQLSRFSAANIARTFSPERCQRELTEVAASMKITVADLLLSYILKALSEFMGENVVLGMFEHGRVMSDAPHLNLSDYLGWMAYSYPAVWRVDRKLNPSEFAKSIAHQRSEIPELGQGWMLGQAFAGPEIKAKLTKPWSIDSLLLDYPLLNFRGHLDSISGQGMGANIPQLKHFENRAGAIEIKRNLFYLRRLYISLSFSGEALQLFVSYHDKLVAKTTVEKFCAAFDRIVKNHGAL